MVLGVYMWAKKGSRESSFKVLDNRGSHDWKLQSSCGKITDSWLQVQAQLQCCTFSKVLAPTVHPSDSAACVTTPSQTTSETSSVTLMSRPQGQHTEGDVFLSETQEVPKAVIHAASCSFSCRCFKVNLERCNGNFNKNPWLQIHSTYILKHSWVALCGSTISIPAPPLLCGG